MSKLIAVSDEVYLKLSKYKVGGKSFTEVIKGFIEREEKSSDIMRFAGILKHQSKELDEFKKQIQADRKAAKSRRFDL